MCDFFHLFDAMLICIIMLYFVACRESSSASVIAQTTRHNEYARCEDDAVAPGAAFAMPPAQLAEMKNKAVGGDGKAAYKVYQYYELYKYGGPGCSQYWLKMAVTNGSVDAKEALEARERCEAAEKRLLWRLE